MFIVTLFIYLFHMNFNLVTVLGDCGWRLLVAEPLLEKIQYEDGSGFRSDLAASHISQVQI